MRIKGNHYFLSIKNKAILLSFVYPIKTKDKALDKFDIFKKKYENLIDSKLKIIRADRGGEFDSHQIKLFCNNLGISIKYSAPYIHA